ncbi:hypothetical protein QBC43DRAFT_360165 [Cladorrhinum sp. PSN259]|nr:hypothetical protein QBC43DRAFT_360165 [Cladorrhinum sp. PSN259]
MATSSPITQLNLGTVPKATNYEPQYYHKVLRNMELAKSLAIFRRFDDINLRNVMSLQAEITTLDEMLKQRQKIDFQNPQCPPYNRSFKALRDSHLPRKHQDSNQDCRNAGRDDALILQVSKLSELPSPPKSQLQMLKDLLRFEGERLPADGDDTFPPSAEYVTWEDSDPERYYTLDHQDAENDSLTQLMKGYILPVFHWLVGKRLLKSKVIDAEAGLSYYEDEKLVKASSIIVVMISSALPVATIYVLNKVDSTNIRIAWTIGFTMIFAGMLVLFSSAKRAEIFAATAT